MADSPTPTVPISSDSTSVISTSVPSCFTSANAAIQPAVPPPAITTRLIVLRSHSAIEPLQQVGAQPPRRSLVERSEDPAGVIRQMRGGTSGIAEHVIIEQRAPGLLLLLAAGRAG